MTGTHFEPATSSNGSAISSVERENRSGGQVGGSLEASARTLDECAANPNVAFSRLASDSAASWFRAEWGKRALNHAKLAQVSLSSPVDKDEGLLFYRVR